MANLTCCGKNSDGLFPSFWSLYMTQVKLSNHSGYIASLLIHWFTMDKICSWVIGYWISLSLFGHLHTYVVINLYCPRVHILAIQGKTISFTLLHNILVT